MEKELALKTVTNIGYNSFAKAAVLILKLATSIVLAHRLSANDYGVVGFATIIMGFLSQFGDLGIDAALIQRLEVDRRTLCVGLTMKFLLGIVIYMTAFVAASHLKGFFDHPQIENVVRVLAIGFVISSFSFMSEVTLIRALDYKVISAGSILASFTRSAVAIALVLNGFAFWSIVFGEVAAGLAQVIFLNIMRPMRMGFRYDKETATGILSFGGNLFLTNIVLFLLLNADNFLIGTVGGARMLGFYALAFTWGSMVCGVLYDAVHNVLFPTFSKMQLDREGMKRAYLRVLEIVTVIGILVNMTLVVNSREILFFILGNGTVKWIPAVPVLEIFAVYGIVRMMLEPVSNIAMAVGRPGVLLKANMIAGGMELGLLYPVMKAAGIEGVAVLVTVAYSVQYAIYLPFLKRECGIGYGEWFGATKWALLSGMVTSVTAAWIWGHMSLSITSMVLKFAYCVSGYCLLYGTITHWKLARQGRSFLEAYLAQRKGKISYKGWS